MKVKLEKTCPHCKISFDPKHQHSIYEKEKITCPWCGAVFKPTKREIK